MVKLLVNKNRPCVQGLNSKLRCKFSSNGPFHRALLFTGLDSAYKNKDRMLKPFYCAGRQFVVFYLI